MLPLFQFVQLYCITKTVNTALKLQMFSQLKYSSAVLVQQIVSVVIFWYSRAATVLCWHTKHNPHYICYFCFIRLRENTVVCFVWMNTGIEISGNICLYYNARRYKHSYIGIVYTKGTKNCIDSAHFYTPHHVA